MTGVIAAVVMGLLVVSAALSAAEAATFRVGGSRLRTLKDEGFKGAEALGRLRSRPGRVQAGVRILCGALNLAALGVTVWAGAAAWGKAGGLLQLLGLVLVVLLLADILPRAVVTRHPVRLALLAAPMLVRIQTGVDLAARPFIRLEDVLTGDGDADVSEEERELHEIQQLGREAGIVGDEETLLVERAFRLDELTVWDVMTPRVDIFGWKDSSTLEDIVEELFTVPYSRVPVYGDSVDDITGILYVREAYETLVKGHRDVPLSRISRNPLFVPGSLPLTRLLRDFQAHRIHMGIVADEFGGTDGLVTLEDVLEELVGEIVDETDVAEEPFHRVSRNELLADAGVDLRELNHAFNVALPQLDHRSLNGFLLEELGHVPEPGETIERAGIRIEVVEASETQVVRARLTRLSAEEEAPSDESGS